MGLVPWLLFGTLIKLEPVLLMAWYRSRQRYKGSIQLSAAIDFKDSFTQSPALWGDEDMHSAIFRFHQAAKSCRHRFLLDSVLMCLHNDDAVTSLPTFEFKKSEG